VPVLLVLLVNSLMLPLLSHLPVQLVMIPPTVRLALMPQQQDVLYVMMVTIWMVLTRLAVNARILIVMTVMILLP